MPSGSSCRKRPNLKRLKWLIPVLVVLLGLTALSAYRGETVLTVTHYTVAAPLENSLRIVQLTDLHGHSFGRDNGELVALVAEQEPELIFMTGDMLDKTDDNADMVCALIEELSQIAPVYYGYGNHEYDWMSTHGESLTPVLTRAGATVLDVEYVDVEVAGNRLRIGGYHGYYRQPHMFPVTQEQKEKELGFCQDFEDTGDYKILLSHVPTAWLDWGYIDCYPVDLVLSGHYHGGQVRLPFIGGLYAPYVGLFPEYTEGLYIGEMATCILSRGLGSSPGIPRINNLPEILVIDLIPG